MCGGLVAPGLTEESAGGGADVVDAGLASLASSLGRSSCRILVAKAGAVMPGDGCNGEGSGCCRSCSSNAGSQGDILTAQSQGHLGIELLNLLPRPRDCVRVMGGFGGFVRLPWFAGFIAESQDFSPVWPTGGFVKIGS